VPATGLVAPTSGRRVGFTLPFAAGDSRAGALTAAYAGATLTLRLSGSGRRVTAASRPR
jgi:hypothetical protein